MDTVDLLKAFIATAQTGSFTGAAERLRISNRLTSKYVAELEARLGTRLLQRTTRKVGLTSSGQDLLQRAPALLNELDDLLGSVTQDARGLSGTLRISAPVTLGEYYVQDLLGRFAEPHPDLIIDLRLSDSYIDLAAEGIDLAFRGGGADNATMKLRKLGTINNSLVASPEYLEKNGTPESPEDLLRHTCILDTNRQGLNWPFHKDGQDTVINPPRRFMVNSGSVARQWAMKGLGITLCPDIFMTQQLKDGSLVRLLSDYHTISRPLNAIYLEGTVLPRKIRALIDFTLSDIKSHPVLSPT